MTLRSRRIIAFPKAGNAYVECLYAEVQSRGFEVIDGIWSARWLRENVQRRDLIHIHWPSFLYYDPKSRWRSWKRVLKYLLLLLYTQMRGATFVWTAHNLYPHEGGRDLLVHHVGRRITVLFADSICAHGESAADIVCREFGVPRSRVRIGYHGHWIDHYPNQATREQSRLQLDIPPDEFVYLFLGRCKPYKGLESLIPAFAQLPGRARLLIAGGFSSDHYLGQIRALAQDVPGVQILPQYVPDDRLQLLLNAADCVVLPYLTILTSGSAMLALSFGRPVIAPDLGAMRDHVDSTCGILYSSDEPSGLTQALGAIRNRRFDSAAIIARARTFTWTSLAAILTENPPD